MRLVECFAEGHASLRCGGMLGLHEHSAEDSGYQKRGGGIVVEKDNHSLHKSMMANAKSMFSAMSLLALVHVGNGGKKPSPRHTHAN